MPLIYFRDKTNQAIFAFFTGFQNFKFMLDYYDLSNNFGTMSSFLSKDTLPLIEDSASHKQSDQRKPCCLIFAADENIRILYKTLLTIWKYEVIEATTPAQALWLTRFRKPDMVLMDTQINFFDSLLTMKKLKAEETFDGVPFILLSGHAQAEIRQWAMTAGARAFCVKPVDFNVLENILGGCLG